jgi:hypothetical protein
MHWDGLSWERGQGGMEEDVAFALGCHRREVRGWPCWEWESPQTGAEIGKGNAIPGHL